MEPLQDEKLEERAVVVEGDAPLLEVVADHDRIGGHIAPAADAAVGMEGVVGVVIERRLPGDEFRANGLGPIVRYGDRLWPRPTLGPRWREGSLHPRFGPAPA
jgi:hypothetical protein